MPSRIRAECRRSTILALVACWSAGGCQEPPAGETTTEGESSGSTTTEPSSTTGVDDTADDTVETDTTGLEPPEGPVLELGYSPIKQFDFRWAPVAGAEHYELLESAALGEPFVPLEGDIEGESISITMPLHLRAEASYVLRACDGADCIESAPVSAMGSLAEAIGYFKASSPGTGDYFGGSVALSGDGNTLAARAEGTDAVDVFVRDAMGQWSQQAHFDIPHHSYLASDNSIALSGDGSTLAVGSTSPVLAGTVYLFVRDSIDQWSQQAYVEGSNPAEWPDRDQFGCSVALSTDGNTLAVGAMLEGESQDPPDTRFPMSFPGGAYVFVRDAMGAWSQQLHFEASYPDDGLWLGWYVALSGDGNVLAIRASLGTTVLVRNVEHQWSERAFFDVVGDAALSRDGQVLAIAADDGVHMFLRNATGRWSQQPQVIVGHSPGTDEHYVGKSVAMSDDGRILAIGATGENGSATGIDGAHGGEPAPGAGAVYVLVHDDVGHWSQRAYVKASNTDAGDDFGTSVALSCDGQTLAVGAVLEDGNAIGIGGDQADDSTKDAGAVYLY